MKKKLITIITILAICGPLSGCLKPHVVDVQQGNIMDQKQLTKLNYGMSKEAVRSLLGDPVLIDAFDDNSWTYTYTNQINGGKIYKQYLTLHFENNKLSRVDGKDIPPQLKGPVTM